MKIFIIKNLSKTATPVVANLKNKVQTKERVNGKWIPIMRRPVRPDDVKPENYNAPFEALELNIPTIDQAEFKRLTNAMMEGIPVSINGHTIDLQKYGLKPMPKCMYKIVDLVSPAQIPPEIRNIKGSAFKDAIFNHNTKIKERVEAYIAKRIRFTQNLDERNKFYNALQMECFDLGITAYSPCNKTYFEAKAEYEFQHSFPNNDGIITEEQIEFCKLNAPKFGIELPTLRVYTASRHATKTIAAYDDYGNYIGNSVTDHGYTEEIQRVLHTRENYFSEKEPKNYRAAFHPANIPEEWMVADQEPTKKQWKDVYEKLMYFINLPADIQDEFIALGYTRCPHCGQIVKQYDDGQVVRCSLCDSKLEEFSTTSNDMLLYGTDIKNSYSSLEDVNDYISQDGLEDIMLDKEEQLIDELDYIGED